MKIFSTTKEAIFFLTHPSLWFRKPLKESDLESNPLDQFSKWFDQAKSSPFGEFPNALCLSTVGEDGYPEGRIVLLKGHDESGFVFYTNKNSRKGKSLDSNPKAAMTFYWESLQHQVRVQGDIERVEDEEADHYFKSRPRGSQIGAWASLQSDELSSREELEERVSELNKKYKNQEIPRPPHWTGYRLKPKKYEFWELRLSRLHDRFEYVRAEDGSWNIQRLYP